MKLASIILFYNIINWNESRAKSHNSLRKPNSKNRVNLHWNGAYLCVISSSHQKIQKGGKGGKTKIVEMHLKRMEYHQCRYLFYHLGGQEVWDKLLDSQVNRSELQEKM